MPIGPLRAKQSTSTTGTGTLTLIAAPAAARGFQAAYGNSARVVRYVIAGTSFFELGIGTYDGGSPGTLARATVLASSNAGALVSIPAGTWDVFAWIDQADRWLMESTATSITLALADLGNLLIWSGTSTSGTVNLPALSTVPPGAAFDIINAGTQRLTLDPNGSETVNGVTTLALLPGDAVTVVAATGGWRLAQPLPSALAIGNPTIVSSAVAEVIFSLLPGFSAFALDLTNVAVSTASAQVMLRTSIDGGATYLSGAGSYSWASVYNTVSAPNGDVATNTAVDLSGSLLASNSGNSILLHRINAGASGVGALYAWTAAVIDNAPAWRSINAGGGVATLGRTTHLRIFPSSGNINSMTGALRGLRI